MPTKIELQAEVDRLREMLAQFTDPKNARLVSYLGGVWEFKSPIFEVFVVQLAQMLAVTGAENYVEIKADHRDVGPIVVTIQRQNGKTPHELRLEAESERNAIQVKLKGLAG